MRKELRPLFRAPPFAKRSFAGDAFPSGNWGTRWTLRQQGRADRQGFVARGQGVKITFGDYRIRKSVDLGQRVARLAPRLQPRFVLSTAARRRGGVLETGVVDQLNGCWRAVSGRCACARTCCIRLQILSVCPSTVE